MHTIYTSMEAARRIARNGGDGTDESGQERPHLHSLERADKQRQSWQRFHWLDIYVQT